MRDARQDVAITAQGLVGCLALDAANACAAARAGLSRASELPFLVPDEETGEPTGVVGCSIADMALGFEGAGRLTRIAQLALADLLRSASGPGPVSAGRCDWLIALPEWSDADPAELGGAEGAPAVGAPSSRQVVGIALRAVGAQVDPSRISVHTGRHAAFGVVVEQALATLREGRAEACVVGAVDTLVDPGVLQELMAQGRLKTPNESVGVHPGEGGAFFVLEPREAAVRRGAPILGLVAGVAHGLEQDHLDGKVTTGRALAGLAATITPMHEVTEPPLLVSDYNGEEHRSSEYGHVLFRLGAMNPVFQRSGTWFPATSFGDTGAASAAIGVGMVLRGFARGYAGAAGALVLSSSHDASRAVLEIRAPS